MKSSQKMKKLLQKIVKHLAKLSLWYATLQNYIIPTCKDFNLLVNCDIFANKTPTVCIIMLSNFPFFQLTNAVFISCICFMPEEITSISMF